MSDPRDSRDPSSAPDITAAAEQARARLRREFQELREDLLAQPRPFAEASPEHSRFLGRSGTAALALLGVIAATALGVVTGQIARNGSAPISGRVLPYSGEGDDGDAGPLLAVADNRPALAGGAPASRAAATRSRAGGGDSSPRLVAAAAPSTPPGPSGGSPLPGGGADDGAPAPGPDRQAPPSAPAPDPRPESAPPTSPPAAEPRPGDSPGPVKPPSKDSGGDSPRPVTAGGGNGQSGNGGRGKGKALGHTTAPPGKGGTPPGRGGTPPGQTKPPPGQAAGRGKAGR